MQIGWIGLGKMGKNMVLRLLEHGVGVVAWNRSAGPRTEVEKAGAETTSQLDELISKLTPPRTIWLMLPAGDVTESILESITPLLDPGDLLIDGANSYYRDTIRRAEWLSSQRIRFVDVGVSGGPSGAREGACLMVGGEQKDFDEIKPLIEKLAAPEAYGYFGSHGAGHFVKMVHNGIEYGMMQAIAEGAAVLNASPYHLDLSEVFRVYNQRSVIESRLIGWIQEALSEDSDLSKISSEIKHSGEGEWTVQTAKELGVEVPVIEQAFQIRLKSSADSNRFRDKVVSALRGKFGGHAVTKD